MDRIHPAIEPTRTDRSTRSVANPRRIRVDADGRPVAPTVAAAAQG